MHSFNDMAAVEYCEFLKENQAQKLKRKLDLGNVFESWWHANKMREFDTILLFLHLAT